MVSAILITLLVPALLLLGLLWRARGRDRLLRAREREQAARRIADSEQAADRLRMALDASGAALWEWDIAARQMHLSEGYYRQLGFEPGAFEASTAVWLEQLHPQDREAAIARVREHLAQPQRPYVNEYRLPNAQGQWRWMQARGRVQRFGPGGEPLLMVGTHTDITEQKAQQVALLESRERFQKIYETTPDAMGITRAADGLYIDVNPSFLAVTGYQAGEVLGRTSLALGIWAVPEQRSALVEAYRRDGAVDAMEMQIRRRSGEVVQGLMSVRGLQVDDEDCLLFIYRDISERDRLRREAELAHSKRAAAEAASEAKTEFLSRMSHELRTPLNAVLGFAQLLLNGPDAGLAGRQRAQVESIAQAGWHLLELINDVLDIARIEAGHLQVQSQPVAIEPLIDEALELLAGEVQSQSLQLQTPYRGQALPKVQADPVRLRQALVNLLSNAIKYNQNGGWLRVAAQPEERGLRLTIADSGRGMSRAQMEHLFEPFNRLGREREAIDGTGIGLVLTKHLLELMGATLSLSSTEGAGTTVSMWLPLAPAGLTVQDLPVAPAATDKLHAASLLCIEDNPVNRTLVREMLACWPQLRLQLAVDGAEGLRMALEQRPDLVLLDMRLPDMDGIELLQRLREHPDGRALRVVALSASAMPEEVAAAHAAGAMEYWTKPLELARFRADVQRVLGLDEAADLAQ